jgi:hypothetical protein
MHRAGSNLYLGFAALLLAAAVAGCSGFGAKKDPAATDPNTFPANYRIQISQFLAQSLTNRADFRNAQISAPVLKSVGDSQRYTVCVRLNGNGLAKDKVAIYYGGMMAQFVDATPELCGDAVYTPFRELSGALPPA